MFTKLLVTVLLFVCSKQAASGRITFQLCEWSKPDSRTLTCPTDHVVNIVSAIYGRKSLSICRHGHHKGRTNCGTTASLAKAKSLCNGQKSCSLRASNSMFGDPCWGVNKYLDVTYECQPASGVTWRSDGRCGKKFPLASKKAAECNPGGRYPCCSTSGWCGKTSRHCHCVGCVDYSNKQANVGQGNFQVCEWAKPDSRTITCSGDKQVINIVSAVYGRKSISICGNSHHKGVTNCGSAASFNKAKALCNGKKACTLRASNSMFGDPCWGVNKYLDVKYECKTEGLVKYNIDTKTGNRRYSGTDASVYIYIYGDKGQTGKLLLQKSNSYSNKFENNHLDKFVVEAPDVGRISQIVVGHNNARSGPGWYLDYVNINVLGRPCKMTFNGYRWVMKGSLEAALYPAFDKASCPKVTMRKYKIDVKTSNVNAADTDSNVFIIIYGKDINTGTLLLRKSSTYSDPFERNHLDKFTVNAIDVGAITKIRIGHDNGKHHPGWHLAGVSIAVEGEQCATSFFGGQWIMNGNLVAELHPLLSENSCGKDLTTYNIDVKTGKIQGAGTDSNVFIIIFGDKGDTGKLILRNSKTHSDSFENNQLDKFAGKAVDVGRITMIRVGHDNKGTYPGWYLDKVIIKVKECEWEFSGWGWVWSGGKLANDLYPTLEQGKCEKQVSNGGICDRDYRKIGCFSREWDKVPDLLITDLDPTHKNYTTDMNWDDYTLGLHSLACRCRAKAVGHYKYFGIGFHGECVAGKDSVALETMFKAQKEAEANHNGCINGDLGECNASDANTECSGAADFDFFYEIVE